MNIVAMSDLHGSIPQECLEVAAKGDVVVIAGDIFGRSSQFYQEKFFEEEFLPKFGDLNLPVVFTFGNHDYLSPKVVYDIIDNSGLDDRIFFLANTSKIVHGLTFYGSPWSLPFCDWNWMTTDRQIQQILEATAPKHIDVFVTHSPPFGYGDTIQDEGPSSRHLGCPAVAELLLDLEIPLTVCGHIHSGQHDLLRVPDTEIRIRNVSILDEQYEYHYKPAILEIEDGKTTELEI